MCYFKGLEEISMKGPCIELLSVAMEQEIYK